MQGSWGSDFAPGVLEALEKAMAEGGAEAAPAAAAPVVRFLGDAKRSEAIPLDYPVEVDGIAYHAIVLRRLTTAEVKAFMASLAGKPDDVKVRWPLFRCADDDSVIADAVFDALDDDDMARLDEAALAFLPRRFGGAPASASIPATGAPTAP